MGPEEYDLPITEVAHMLGVAPSTVRNFCLRARANGTEIGRVRAKAGGGAVRMFTQADFTILRHNLSSKRGRPRKDHHESASS